VISKEEIFEALRSYLDGIGALEDATKDLTQEQLDWKLRPEKWSIRQIVAHLADVEMVYVHRIRKTIAEPSTLLTAFDQDAWVNTLSANHVSLAVAIDVIKSLRRFNEVALRNLSEEVLMQSGQHETDGPLTAFQLLSKLNQHLHHHILQIAELRNAQVQTNPEHHLNT